jgi:hypothetical protein
VNRAQEKVEILSAAIRERNTGRVFSGLNHGACGVESLKYGVPIKDCEQGFLTTEGKFVDRYEAARIALASKQI